MQNQYTHPPQPSQALSLRNISYATDLLLEKLEPQQVHADRAQKFTHENDFSGKFQFGINNSQYKNTYDLSLHLQRVFLSKLDSSMLSGATRRAQPHLSCKKAFRHGKFSNYVLSIKMFTRNNLLHDSTVRVYLNAKGKITAINLVLFGTDNTLKHCIKLSGRCLESICQKFKEGLNYTAIIQAATSGLNKLKGKFKATAATIKSTLKKATRGINERYAPIIQNNKNYSCFGKSKPPCRAGPKSSLEAK